MFYIFGTEVLQTWLKILTFEKPRRGNGLLRVGCRLTVRLTPDLARDLVQRVMECKTGKGGRQFAGMLTNRVFGGAYELK